MEPLDWALLPYRRYFDFSGRSSRAEYWYFTALMWFVNLVVLLAQQLLGEAVEGVLAVVNALFGLGTLIPSIAVGVRRLHDINRSGFLVLFYGIGIGVVAVLIPVSLLMGSFAAGLLILGLLVLAVKFLILMVTEGDRGPNPYGSNPYGLSYGY
jgi:uncharacterized membrane protein YhaH (DUF805 family)